MAADDAPPSDPRTSGVTEIREAAKWLIATFGAIAAVIVAGLSLSDLGQVDAGSLRFILTLVGLAAAAVGVIWTVLNAADVLVVEPVTLTDLSNLSAADSAAADATVLGPATSAGELATQVPVKYQAAQQSYERYLQAPGNDTLTPYQVAENRAQVWGNAAASTALAVKHERVRSAFQNLRDWLWLKVVLVLAGVGAIAWGLGATETSDVKIGTVTASPTNVVVQFTDDAANNQALVGALGADCVESSTAVSAVALAAQGQRYTLALTPTEKCKAAVVKVGPTLAKVGLPPQKE
jgi:hypothetical protein